MRTAGILGTGLIGGSIGLGLRSAGWRVAGWDPSPDHARDALALGIVEELAESKEAVAEAGFDLVVLAGPPRATIADVAELETRSLVMDVAGVKSPVIAASRLDRFVATHPMAGRETSGPRAASRALFRGAAWVVVTDTAAAGDLDEVEAIIVSLGARPIRMTAAEHDSAVAAVSHLPQVLAAALVDAVASHTSALQLAAGSFRDLTRVASSDPESWIQLLTTNREAVAEVVRAFRDQLDQLASAVEDTDEPHLRELLGRARDIRSGLAPPVVAVRVALADEPGELAKVGHALERTGVDVRDLQLRHAPYGGGGVLTISVRPGEAEALREALGGEGLLLVE